MSTAKFTPTTTYPFVDTTYTNPSPSTQSIYPTTYTGSKQLPIASADTRCSSATAYPSIEGPSGLKPACVIHNAAEINPHAFWDVYECCPGHDITSSSYSSSSGEPMNEGICMVQCTVNEGDGVTWQQVGECLQKKVKEVVCMPRYEERWKNQTRESMWSEYARTRTGGSSQATAKGTGTGQAVSASATASTGAAASFDVVHASSSKMGLFTFLLLAVGSAFGMFL
jgi:hypothetical protein